MEYYPLGFQLDGRVHYVRWFSNDVDGVHTTEHLVSVFASEKAAKSFAQLHDLPVFTSSGGVLNLDWVNANPFDADTVDCILLLEIWNFLADVAASLPGKASRFLALDQKPNDIYDKVFWGNNLPAVTPEGKHYTPKFSRLEREVMKTLFLTGLDLFTRNLKQVM